MTVPACFIFYLKYSLLSKTTVWLGNKGEPYNNKPQRCGAAVPSTPQLLNNPDSHVKWFTLFYLLTAKLRTTCKCICGF